MEYQDQLHRGTAGHHALAQAARGVLQSDAVIVSGQLWLDIDLAASTSEQHP